MNPSLRKLSKGYIKIYWDFDAQFTDVAKRKRAVDLVEIEMLCFALKRSVCRLSFWCTDWGLVTLIRRRSLSTETRSLEIQDGENFESKSSTSCGGLIERTCNIWYAFLCIYWSCFWLRKFSRIFNRTFALNSSPKT